MNKAKRIIALALAAASLVACTAGCGKITTNSDGVKEYTAFISATPPYTEDMPIFKEAEKRTGIRLKNVMSTVSSDEGAAYSTMLSGNKLPDIIRHINSKMKELALDGGLIAIDEYFDEYAPNLKKFFEDCKQAREVAVMPDGHIYFVPGTLTELDKEGNPAMAYFIRKDWLDKLGLDYPTTIQEYHDVLLAFKTKDPNGNGVADEVPYFDRHKSLYGILSLFCTATNQHEYNGKIVWGPATENFKAAMKEFSKWYAEGIIDPEIFTRTNAREQLLGQNIGGSCNDWISSTSKFNDTLKESIPGFSLMPFLPPENYEGRVEDRHASRLIHDWSWGISRDADKDSVIALVKYLDFWMSEEGQVLRNYGVEGISYTVDENGNKQWTEAATTFPDGVPQYMRSIGGFEMGTIASSESNYLGMNEIGKQAFKMYEEYSLPQLSEISLTDEELEIVNKYAVNVQTASDEQCQKWILGVEDVDATWDAHINKLNSMGLQELLKAYNAAYDRMKKNN